MSYKKGIDVSNNDGSVDFSKVAADGIEYVYLKATEGKSFKDSYMDGFYNDCKSNGLKVGAYHFLVGTSTPEEQARNFYAKIKDYEWDLVPMMDIETEFSGLSDYVVRFINSFNQISSLQLGIYSYTGFISNIEDIQDIIKYYPFWEANYNNNPWNLKDNFFTNRIGHQYTETGLVNGVNCNCDVNSFTEGVLLNGVTIQGEWIQDESTKKWWYKHVDGSYTKADWEKINGEWYYFDYKGWMCTGWIVVKEKDYYLYSNGVMAHDCDLYGYRFDSNGVATKLS